MGLDFTSANELVLTFLFFQIVLHNEIFHEGQRVDVLFFAIILNRLRDRLGSVRPSFTPGITMTTHLHIRVAWVFRTRSHPNVFFRVTKGKMKMQGELWENVKTNKKVMQPIRIFRAVLSNK